MTQELFDRALRLQREISAHERLIGSSHFACHNIELDCRAKDEPKTADVCQRAVDAANDIVNNYLKERLNALKAEFEKL